MAKVEIKTKEAKAKAAMAGGKGKKKKWNKGKVREKLANLVLFDQKTLDKLIAEVPKLKLITVSVVSERLKIGGSLARAALKELLDKGLIRVLSYHAKQAIYTRATNVDEAKLSKGGEKKARAAAAAAAAEAADGEEA